MEVEFCKASEIPVGTMRAETLDEARIVVFHHEDGSFSALEDRCSHADVKLSRGSFGAGQVVCPAHGAKFDAKTGKQLCMPAVRPVRTYAVREVEGTLMIVLD